MLAYDNIDHNPRSTTCRSSFHGSCMSVIQFPSTETPGERIFPADIINPDEVGKSEVAALPATYTTLTEVIYSRSEQAYVPDMNISLPLKHDPQPTDTFLQQSYRWLNHAQRLIDLDGPLPDSEWISWGAYHAKRHSVTLPVTPSYMLPLFRESATSPTMIYHAMKTCIAVTNHLNPGQVPVIIADQPLHYTLKRLQIKYPEEVGEAKLLTMLGPMHTEKMLWESAGSYLEGSGWTSVLSVSGVHWCFSSHQDALFPPGTISLLLG